MRLLLIDTCGDTGSLAFAEDGAVLRQHTLPARTASALLVSAIRSELMSLGWPLHSLEAVCVVNGPGSFTGVRVGLAAAKGLCDAAGLRLVTLSRLEVLLSAGTVVPDRVAVLDAGRGEFYVRAADSPEEKLLGREELLEQSTGRSVVVAEEKLLAALEPLQPTWIELSAAHALPLATTRLAAGSDNVETADANYVRHARALYATGPRTTSTPERP